MLKVCYVTNWSRYRPGEAKFEIEFIDPFMCSHIIYAYAIVDERKGEIIPVQQDDIGTSLHKNLLEIFQYFLIIRALSRIGTAKKIQSKSKSIDSIRWKNCSIHTLLETFKYGCTISS